MRRRILVTGGTGLVGNNVIRLLVEQGHNVVALVRAGSSSRPLEGLDVETVVGDVQDRSSIIAACNNVDAVVHSAGIVRIGWSLAGNMREINVDGTRHVVNAAEQNGCRLVHVSTVNALAVTGPDEANEETPSSGNEIACNYVETKRAADTIVHEAIADGLDATIVYPGMMLGPWDWKPSSGQMLLAVGRQFTPAAPAGGISVSDVRDVAKSIVGIATADEAPPHRDYITAGHNLTYFELWQRMATVAGARPPVFRIGKLLEKSLCLGSDVISKVLPNESLVNSAAIRMGQQFHYYDSHRAQSDLGYRISDLDATIADAWQWLNEYHS